MKHWTKDDRQTLTRLYATRSNAELAETLHRSVQSVAVKANKMGLHKSDIYLAQHGLQKGYTPHNKGRRMEEWLSPEVHEKIKVNQARTAEERSAIAKKMWETRRRRQAARETDKNAELDAILADIRKSNNSIYYKSKI